MKVSTSWPMIAGAALAPFVAAWPVLHTQGSAFGPGLDAWGVRMLWATAFAIIAVLLVTLDHPWLGAAVSLGVIDALVMSLESFSRSAIGLVALGSLALVWVQTWADKHHLAVRVLGIAGLVQAVVMLGQAAGYDPLWRGFVHVPVTSYAEAMRGTFGNPAFSASYVALTTLLLPAPFLLLAVAVCALASSKIALLALIVGGLVRVWPRWAPVLMAAGVAALGAGVGLTSSGLTRLAYWSTALLDWWTSAKWLGYGVNLAPVPSVDRLSPAYDPSPFWPLHNEPLQWLVERGLVGGAIFAGWIVTSRRALSHPFAGGAVAALVILSLAQSVLHVAALALAAVLVLGVAITPTSDPIGA